MPRAWMTRMMPEPKRRRLLIGVRVVLTEFQATRRRRPCLHLRHGSRGESVIPVE